MLSPLMEASSVTGRVHTSGTGDRAPVTPRASQVVRGVTALLLALFAFVSGAMTAGAAGSHVESFIVTPGTEHKIGTWIGLGKEKACVWGENAQTSTPVPVRYRRSLNGHPKELDTHTGRKCFFTKGGTWYLYATALDVTTRVYVESWDNPSVGGPEERPSLPRF
jgi:hypothetical protein